MLNGRSSLRIRKVILPKEAHAEAQRRKVYPDKILINRRKLSLFIGANGYE